MFSMNQLEALISDQQLARVDLTIEEVDEFFNLLKLEAKSIDFLKAKNKYLTQAPIYEIELNEKIARTDLKIEEDKEFQAIIEKFNNQPHKKESTSWLMPALITTTAIPIALDAVRNKEKSFLIQSIKRLATSSVVRYAAILGATGIGANLTLKHPQMITNCTNGIESAIKTSWNNKVIVAKASMLLAAILYANYLTRGQESLLVHMAQHGSADIIPSIIDQYIATIQYSIRLVSAS